ncbi:GMC oxidoreductase [Archangium violaceum]|uniref:GMC oxidoreductase n=1 Tax=Archangium violaceum TaxID=83451 RepID=UPI0036DF46D6
MTARPEHFDAIIVGSGFGGSVMCYRLAEAGLRVCLLERGKVYPPGSFPRSPREIRHGFWDPGRGLHGLFNIWSFRWLGGVVASGLGGGSLLYANVLIRKDEHTFVREDRTSGGYEYWPVTRQELEAHYDQVEAMMKAQRFPFEHEPYRSTPKTQAMKQAAGRLGYEWFLPKLGVTFGNPGQRPVPGEPILESAPNLHGRTRLTCRMCGECNLGCNYGSKNSLDYTYLSAAKRLGAELRPRCEVKAFRPDVGGGYAVEYVDYSGVTEGEPLPREPRRHLVTADRLILAAGTFGTNQLLLRNRHSFPRLSRQLGMRFSGNGDLLAFLLDSKNSDSGTSRPRVLDGGNGPVITSAIRVRDALEGGDGRGFYIQDAGHPELLNWLYESRNPLPMMLRSLKLAGRLAREWARTERRSDIGAHLAEALGPCMDSATSMALLGMGRDIPDGRLRLTRHGTLDLDWSPRGGSARYFRRLRGAMEEIASALEGELAHNPLGYLGQMVTVHPLGGCAMGRDKHEGVVDAHGEVFGYPGLYVADGSVMPGPVGPNPALTIAALSDRFAERLLARRPIHPSTGEQPGAEAA